MPNPFLYKKDWPDYTTEAVSLLQLIILLNLKLILNLIKKKNDLITFFKYNLWYQIIPLRALKINFPFE